ncbi:hypothetical protein WJX75_009431 [Coccomyxa subellipsoidea]|uniref:Uncharacterized protein n=1 Tax=Coccomyxa subellipsoidea TaxID=248742 RepID=A0ABR2YCQ1_9CHLO
MSLLLKILALSIAHSCLIAASESDRYIYRIIADTFNHAGQPDVEESELRGDEKMGNNPVTAHPQIGIEQRSKSDTKLPAKQRLLQFRAGAECWQESTIDRGVCNVIFGADTQPLLKWILQARSKNIKFSHCSLSFGNEPPLKSTLCFTPNETLSEGEPRVVLAHLRALQQAQHTPKLRFSASFDDNREFVTQELVFDTQYDIATAPETT